jgi:hypothetical protein
VRRNYFRLGDYRFIALTRSVRSTKRLRIRKRQNGDVLGVENNHADPGSLHSRVRRWSSSRNRCDSSIISRIMGIASAIILPLGPGKHNLDIALTGPRVFPDECLPVAYAIRQDLGEIFYFCRNQLWASRLKMPIRRRMNTEGSGTAWAPASTEPITNLPPAPIIKLP